MQWQSAYWIVSKLISPKRHNRGKTQWTIKSFILQSSHIMILNSTKFGGNRTKDLEVGPDRQTGRFLYTPQTTFAGGIIMCRSGTTCLPADCCFSINRTSSSSHRNETYSRHDIAEKLLTYHSHKRWYGLDWFLIGRCPTFIVHTAD